MSRRKTHKHHIRNLQKDKSTYFVSIPVNIVREFGWRDRQKLEVKSFGKKK